MEAAKQKEQEGFGELKRLSKTGSTLRDDFANQVNKKVNEQRKGSPKQQSKELYLKEDIFQK